MTTLFISDLHLEESRRDITDAFLNFMKNEAQQANTLYILGDFFEAWIGDDEQTPLQVEIIKSLKAYTDSGRSLYFMHGNRDFLIGQLFAEMTGATLLPDPSIISLGNEKVILLHGDSLCTKDEAYMKFRKNMRNEQWQQMFLQRPLPDRKTTAQQLRAISMAKNKGKKEDIMDVTEEEVISLMNLQNVTVMIHGHTHRPKVHEVPLANHQSGKRYVLGDWDSSVWYIHADDKGNLDLIQRNF